MIQKNRDLRSALRALKSEKSQFKEQTFSYSDLVKFGLTKKEIEKIPAVTKYGILRYESLVVHHFLKYEKGIKLQ